MILTITLSIIFMTIDQISKIIVVKNLSIHNGIEVIKNFFYLTYTNNDGAAFSILMGKRLFLILVALIIVILLLIYIKRNKPKNKYEILAYSFIIGGSLGNLIDRIVRGYVIDFISVKIFGYYFPIFNIADSLIVIGAFLLVLTFNRKDDKHEDRNK